MGCSIKFRDTFDGIYGHTGLTCIGVGCTYNNLHARQDVGSIIILYSSNDQNHLRMNRYHFGNILVTVNGGLRQILSSKDSFLDDLVLEVKANFETPLFRITGYSYYHRILAI